MGKVKAWLMELQEMNSVGPCPVCDGDGLEAVEVFKSQSFSRDVGEPYEEMRHCEACDGSGEIALEDEDDRSY